MRLFRTLLPALGLLVACGGKVRSESSGTGGRAPAASASASASPAVPPPAGTTGGSSGGGGASPWLAFDAVLDGTRRIAVTRIDALPAYDVHPMFPTETDDAREPAFALRTDAFAFTSDRSGTPQIWFRHLAGGAATQVTHHAGGADQPALSADGTEIAFHGGVSVFVIGVDGTNERQVAAGVDALNAYEHPLFVADGSGLVVDRMNLIAFMDDTGAGYREILQNTTTLVETPALSPDGSTVAFGLMCGGAEALWTAPFDSKTDPCRGGVELKATALTRKPAYGWNGVLAFEQGSGPSSVGILTPDGNETVVSSSISSDEQNPAFAPQGAPYPASH